LRLGVFSLGDGIGICVEGSWEAGLEQEVKGEDSVESSLERWSLNDGDNLRKFRLELFLRTIGGR